jgi:NADH:ubiquinone oxidoreductase subunit 5 (subunit L)/multisubunit Na+/H+ antiporter MnhA subunit
MYRNGIPDPNSDPLPKRLGASARRFLAHAWFIDEGVSTAVERGAAPAATALAEVIDQQVIDGAVRGTGAAALRSGSLLSRLQNGAVRSGALGIAAGTIAFLAALIVWFAR